MTNKIIKNLKLGLAGLLFTLNSCSNLTMKGFDKINCSEMPREELKITLFDFPLEYNKIKNISEGKYGTKVLLIPI